MKRPILLLVAIVVLAAAAILFMRLSKPPETSITASPRTASLDSSAIQPSEAVPVTLPTSSHPVEDPPTSQPVVVAQAPRATPPPASAAPIVPPPLQRVLAHWTLTGMADDTAFFLDEAIPKDFTMKIQGESKIVAYPGWSFEISVEKIDVSQGAVYLRSNKHPDPMVIKLNQRN